jgi:hypothetical protein
VFEFDKVGDGLGIYATGSITCIAKTNFVDGETLTISDGTHTATIFEFDKDGGGVAGGHVQVDISGATTAADVAAILVTAINGVTTTLTVTATDNMDGTIALAADAKDTTHNVTITETVANASFLVSGMSGGRAGVGTVAVDISSATTAAQVATALYSAINGVTTGLTVTATDNGDGTLSLLADTADTTHNVTITETVADTGFLVSGMSGGLGTTYYGTPTNMEGKRFYGAQSVWTGSPTGTFSFEASDDYDKERDTGNWTVFTMTVAGSNPAGSASTTLHTAVDFCHRWIRPKYSASNTTAGVLNMTAVAK